MTCALRLYKRTRLGNVAGNEEGNKGHDKVVQGNGLHQLLAFVPGRVQYLDYQKIEKGRHWIKVVDCGLP